jgi:MtN3 and saliva related transmembrane protein
MDMITAVGGMAALCTTVSYFPQLKKCWQTGQARDLSLRMFLVLAAGVALWVVYGVLKSDAVIVGANGVSLVLLSGILYFKLREPEQPIRSRAYRKPIGTVLLSGAAPRGSRRPSTSRGFTGASSSSTAARAAHVAFRVLTITLDL